MLAALVVTMMDHVTIAAAAELCNDEFSALLSSEQLRKRADKADAVEEERARFRIWAAHIGTFAKYHASLDYRLRESKTVRSLVLSQLELLRGAECRLWSVLHSGNLVFFNMIDSS